MTFGLRRAKMLG